jgi:hypothetical protein
MEFTVFETFGRKNRSFLYVWPNDETGKPEPDPIPGTNHNLRDRSTFHYFL